MELQLKDKEGKVIGTLDFPLDILKEKLASLSSNGSSVLVELQAALAPLSEVKELLPRVEARLHVLTDVEKGALVEHVFDHMGPELYIAAGVKRGYIETDGTNGGDEEEDLEFAGHLMSTRDHKDDPGWEYADSLGVWVKAVA